MQDNKLIDNLISQEEGGAWVEPKVGWGADDVVILFIGAILSLYTMWRSADFLGQTIPNGLQFRELIIILGIVGMDISMWAWGWTWLHWARTRGQKNTALIMFIATASIVATAAVTDAATYFFGSKLEESIRVIAFFVVVGGALFVSAAAFFYHSISPKVRVERKLREAQAKHDEQRADDYATLEAERLKHSADMERTKMRVTQQLEREQADLELSEQLVKSRAAHVERAKQVAKLKREQDGAFQDLHNVMRIVGDGNGNGNVGKVLNDGAPTLPPQDPKA